MQKKLLTNLLLRKFFGGEKNINILNEYRFSFSENKHSIRLELYSLKTDWVFVSEPTETKSYKDRKRAIEECVYCMLGDIELDDKLIQEIETKHAKCFLFKDELMDMNDNAKIGLMLIVEKEVVVGIGIDEVKSIKSSQHIEPLSDVIDEINNLLNNNCFEELDYYHNLVLTANKLRLDK